MRAPRLTSVSYTHLDVYKRQGYAMHIEVSINEDNSITVVDDGRGIPTGMHESGMSAVELVLTKLHAGGKFGGGGYKAVSYTHLY